MASSSRQVRAELEAAYSAMFPLESLFKVLNEDGGRYILMGGHVADADALAEIRRLREEKP